MTVSKVIHYLRSKMKKKIKMKKVGEKKGQKRKGKEKLKKKKGKRRSKRKRDIFNVKIRTTFFVFFSFVLTSVFSTSNFHKFFTLKLQQQ